MSLAAPPLVDAAGKRPDYREPTEPPQLTISTVETEHRDWFDLGVIVTINERNIPFDHIFRALAQGQEKLLLVDGDVSVHEPASVRAAADAGAADARHGTGQRRSDQRDTSAAVPRRRAHLRRPQLAFRSPALRAWSDHQRHHEHPGQERDARKFTDDYARPVERGDDAVFSSALTAEDIRGLLEE
ncbi:MAG: hypothetical protein ACYCZY_06165 [Lacisediminihabitans sp.]